jgi:hypothetical protein
MFTGKKLTAMFVLALMTPMVANADIPRKKIILKRIVITGEATAAITGEAKAATGEAAVKIDTPTTPPTDTSEEKKPEEKKVENVKPFTDVDIGSPYFVQLAYLKSQNLIKGYNDGSFKPNATINRAEAAAAINNILLNFDLSTNATNKEIPYTDLTKDNWAYAAVEKLTTLGITNGSAKKTTDKKTKKTTETTQFKPSETINLAAAVKMIMSVEMIHDSALKLPTDKKSSFVDVKGTEWFAPYIELANQKTLLSYSTTNLPDGLILKPEGRGLYYLIINHTRRPIPYATYRTKYFKSARAATITQNQLKGVPQFRGK